MMAKKMNEKSDGYCYVEAYGDGDFMNYLEGCDLILVGPQIRHEIPRIKTFVDASVPVVSTVSYTHLDVYKRQAYLRIPLEPVFFRMKKLQKL